MSGFIHTGTPAALHGSQHTNFTAERSMCLRVLLIIRFIAATDSHPSYAHLTFKLATRGPSSIK
ncbi:hypothetical protein [Caudoviricetes sp.]|nr:hypothetical protein [Caudoviricetes sp.]